eukprot:GFYU01009167.1.p1 GENE.GFYU01009167.1~~GFYU01009167.1.p1  ORF type:complete len:432 (+),score=71.85 GFYU01009167.1:182-1477(+)
MGERKVLNKYYPADFDPSNVPRFKRSQGEGGKLTPVRLMMPLRGVQCAACDQYMYQGTKFNARKETVVGEDYLGIKKYRFYMKCRNCLNEFTMKTDPANSDYTCETGCKRLHEPWKSVAESDVDAGLETSQGRLKASLHSMNDQMALLEGRMKAAADELKRLDSLRELQDLNRARERNFHRDVHSILDETRTKLETLSRATTSAAASQAASKGLSNKKSGGGTDNDNTAGGGVGSSAGGAGTGIGSSGGGVGSSGGGAGTGTGVGSSGVGIGTGAIRTGGHVRTGTDVAGAVCGDTGEARGIATDGVAGDSRVQNKVAWGTFVSGRRVGRGDSDDGRAGVEKANGDAPRGDKDAVHGSVVSAPGAQFDPKRPDPIVLTREERKRLLNEARSKYGRRKAETLTALNPPQLKKLKTVEKRSRMMDSLLNDWSA